MHLATRNSEADPMAVLVTFLVRFGVELKGPFLQVGDSRHTTAIYAALVGNSSKARKGTSASPVRRLFQFELEDDYQVAATCPGPLSTGEGLVHIVRDPEDPGTGSEFRAGEPDRGVEDKRLFINVEEMVSALRGRSPSLSVVLRNFWDSGTAQPLTKTNRIRATNAHVSLLGHITAAELQSRLPEDAVSNGLANRFLWVAVARRQLVAFPQPMPMEELRPLQLQLLRILELGQSIKQMTLGHDAEALWSTVYPALSAEYRFPYAGLLNRGEAQVLRLSMIYALLEGKAVIGAEHLGAALSLWQYCFESVRVIFDDPQSTPAARKILLVLQDGPCTRTQLYEATGRNLLKARLDDALAQLLRARWIKLVKHTTPTGRVVDAYELYEMNEPPPAGPRQ